MVQGRRLSCNRGWQGRSMTLIEGGGNRVAKSVLREAVRALAGALATAVSNQPLRPRNGLRAAATVQVDRAFRELRNGCDFVCFAAVVALRGGD